MLEAVIAIVAGLLIAIGVTVMIGPALPRTIWAKVRSRRPARMRGRRRKATPPLPAESSLHPTTQKAVMLTVRIATILRAQGRDAYGANLKRAVQKLRGDEAAGLYALLAAIRDLRMLSLDQPEADRQLQRLVGELRQAVRDRAEQLELLPFR